MTQPINVFFSVDDNYLQHFTVAATSLLENNRDLSFHFYVINTVKNIRELEVVETFLKKTYDINISLINIGHIDFARFTTNEKYTSAAYFRLFLADILPDDVIDGLVLDSDLVVTRSIKELCQVNITEKYIYAASEAFVKHNITRLNRLGLNLKGYFNSGVMLVNLKSWRKDALTEKFLSVADKYMSELEWYDQDIFNIYFANNWGEFDQKYNAIHLQKELPTLPVIVHYASFSKPWYYIDTHPYNYLYWKYLNMTPFKGRKPLGFSFKNFILKNGRLVKRSMRKAGIIKW